MVRSQVMGMAIAALCACAGPQARPTLHSPEERAAPVRPPMPTERALSDPRCVPEHPESDLDFTMDPPGCAPSMTAEQSRRAGARAELSQQDPANPRRAVVAAAMRSVTPQVRACGGGGVVVYVVFNRRGRVDRARALGAHEATPEGACAVAAVASAEVPPFEHDSFSVTFPFAR